MNWSDTAIILSAKKFGENAAIISAFTKEHGLHKGLVKYASSKKNRGIYQIGNIVEIEWKGRLAEQLGSYTAELTTPIAATILHDQLRLLALQSLCEILEKTITEHDPHVELFHNFELLLLALQQNHSSWLAHYIAFELQLLSELGFGLDLSQCVATGSTENLTYISPRSGCAVSAEAGAPYKEKLFLLPKFLISGDFSAFSCKDAHNGLAICQYFLNKYVFEPHSWTFPATRMQFETQIKNTALVV
jgi:DNA repair protein RecO (recombination protein O)